MAAVLIQPRPETMPGYSLEMDDVHTPASDFNFSQAAFMSSNGSEPFPSFITGPANLGGSSWDATAEGSQNFHDYSDHVDMHPDEDYSTFYQGQITPRKDQAESADEFQSKWAVGASVAEASIPSAEPMRRIASKSSTGSHKHRTIRASSNKKRSKIITAVSRGSPTLSGYDMTGNALAYQEGPMVNQYLVQDPDALSVSPLYSGLAMAGLDGLSYGGDLASNMVQHVDPTCTQMHMDYEPSVSGNSPSHSWDSSRRSSPGADDLWSLPLASSPTASDDSSSPVFQGQSPRNSRKPGHQMMPEDLNAGVMASVGDDFALPPAFTSRRQSGESESARDHYLYKQATPHTDGLFHCPWEGQPSCNHKAEKLKCNYDKFVDSHLKPYRCKHESCENTRFSSTACLLRHEREAHAMHGHGDKPYLCTYETCDRAVHGNGFPRQWNLKDHMRRVHHDNGASLQTSAASSPPPSGSSQTHAKGVRRRKKDSSDSSTSRKSQKASSGAEKSSSATKAADAQSAAYDKWQQHQKALTSLVSGWTQPDEPNLLQHIQDAQTHLQEIQKISTGYISSQKAELIQRPYARSFPQQSG